MNARGLYPVDRQDRSFEFALQGPLVVYLLRKVGEAHVRFVEQLESGRCAGADIGSGDRQARVTNLVARHFNG